MHHPPDNPPSVRRVVLPSGKTIEVAFFPSAQDASDQAAERGLHVCGRCGSELVFPIDWEEAGRTHWEVVLRCPECGWQDTGVFDQAVVDRFDEELDRGTRVLVRDLKHLMHANMEDEVERFVAALHAGHIEPSDF
jgi:DNA-directed RNA polymerase subunit RPC12/RpoP